MRKIIAETIAVLRTTDGKTFQGDNALQRANQHQNHLDVRAKLDKFDEFLRRMFNVGHNEDNFCERANQETCGVLGTENDFKHEVSGVLLEIFTFIGSDNWSKIHEFLTEEDEQS